MLARLLLLASFGLLSVVSAQGLPEDEGWRMASTHPVGNNSAFATADGCANCHRGSGDALAMRDHIGGDISPFELWRGTMMANSFRDPYWRSQVSREIQAHPKAAKEIQGLCLNCHAPMSSHSARLAGTELPSVRALEKHALARDGVSCTVCHQAGPDNLGKRSSFNGRLDIGLDRVIYGPYEDPFFQPMRMHSNYTATEGKHIQQSALCGSCHTLITKPAPDAAEFPEQTPYLEWRNSSFANEAEGSGPGRSCQECHMVDLGTQTIARRPDGADFNLERRKNYRSHVFVGGNAFMLEMLRDAAKELGVEAPKEAFDRVIVATRQQLTRRTAQLAVEKVRIENGRVRFDVRVTNLCGHKLPTGYPSRRLWLRTQVAVGGEILFENGGVNLKGELEDVKDEQRIPHVNVVRKAADVPVWEAQPVDLKGKPTTLLHSMARYAKDNRLLPNGWKKDGPEVALTGPIGVEGDADFVGGSDLIHFDLPLSDDFEGEIDVHVDLLYQTVPPAWVKGHRSAETKESKRFVRLYDDANTLAEIICSADG